MVLKCFCENLKDLLTEYSISTRLSSGLFLGAPFAALAAISSRARSSVMESSVSSFGSVALTLPS